MNKVEVEKYHLLLQQSLNTFPLDKQKRFFDRMNQMDELMMKEYINKPQKYIDNFEVGGKYNMVIFEEKVREWIEDISFSRICFVAYRWLHAEEIRELKNYNLH